MVVLCQGFSRLGCQGIYSWQTQMQIPWKAKKYLGETSDSDGYTSSWTDPEESDSIPSYLVAQFAGITEADFGFTHPVQEEGDLEEPEEPRPDHLPLDDRSLGEIDVPLTIEWIRNRIAEGLLPADGMSYHGVRSGRNQKRVIQIGSRASSASRITPKSKLRKRRLSISPTL